MENLQASVSKSSLENDLCLDEIMNCSQSVLSKIIFKVKLGKSSSVRYMTIRVKVYSQSGKEIKILQISDVTSQIQYMEIKAQTEFSSLMNTIMSHELRNPLNSIIAKNIEKSALYQKMLELLNRFDEVTKESPGFK